MGLFDFLSGGGGGIKKTVARAINKDAQSIDRFRALEQLREDGSDEAIAGLLRRFGFNYDKSIEDEQEKEWVYETLIEMGDKVLPSLEKALLGDETLSWSLKLLGSLASHDQTWPVLEKVLARNDNQYVRDPSKKIQMLDFIAESFVDERATRAAFAYLEDMDETVRYHAIEVLVAHKNEELAREPLLKLLTSPDESRRIKVRILDGLVDLGWNTHGYKGQVEEIIKDLDRDYSLDAKGRVRKAQK